MTNIFTGFPLKRASLHLRRTRSTISPQYFLSGSRSPSLTFLLLPQYLKACLYVRVSQALQAPLRISMLQVSGVLGNEALDHFCFLFRLQKKNRCKKQSVSREPQESLAVYLPENAAITVFSKSPQSALPSSFLRLLFRKFG